MKLLMALILIPLALSGCATSQQLGETNAHLQYIELELAAIVKGQLDQSQLLNQPKCQDQPAQNAK